MTANNIQATLTNLGGGAAAELFQTDLAKVLANIVDPNTKPDARREISLKVSIKPSKDRELCAVAISTAVKLAPAEAFETQLFVSQRRDGTIESSEYNPRQNRLPFDEPVVAENVIPITATKKEMEV